MDTRGRKGTSPVPSPQGLAFRRDFNIFDAVEAGAYDKFIYDLRNDLGQLSREEIHGRPVLPSGGDKSTFFDVTLVGDQIPQEGTRNATGNGKVAHFTVVVRFRTDNLYLVGYCWEETWWRFSDNNDIPGAQNLGFKGSYDGLKDKSYPRSKIALGRETFLKAVGDLDPSVKAPKVKAKEKDISEADMKIARSLTIIVQSISEAIRLLAVSEFIRESWNSDQGRPPQLILDYEQCWDGMCRALVAEKNSGPGAALDLSTVGAKLDKVQTVSDAVKIVAMINSTAVPKETPSKWPGNSKSDKGKKPAEKNSASNTKEEIKDDEKHPNPVPSKTGDQSGNKGGQSGSGLKLQGRGNGQFVDGRPFVKAKL